MRVCVIGGSRYFGRRVVELLRDDGATVTVLNRGSAPAPPGTTHMVADRSDEAGLRTALAGREFDVVIDQVCYTPSQAATAARVFAGRTGRYLMTSSVEVYDPASSPAIPPATVGVPVVETAVATETWPVKPELPWHDPGFLERHYGEAKRQAEAVLADQSGFDLVVVRAAHVLGGADFTGRLAHYVERMRRGEPIAVHADPQPATFLHHREIAEFLRWAAAGTFTGPVNAAATGELDVTALCARIAAVTGAPPPEYRVVSGDASPYSFDRYYGLSNARAARLGFTFSGLDDWLDDVIREA
ncbi:MAG: NAD-dependent epimerase/dehydratase family protein [Micromonosporaceae bacterium]